MKVLEELYSGNIRPDSHNYGKDTPFAEYVRLREKHREKLLEILSEDGKEIFEEYNEAQGDIDCITRYEKFSTGFRLGVMLMVETFMGMEE